MLAPFWTDLDGTGSPGFYEAVVTQGTRNWIVVQWDEHVFGARSGRSGDAADPGPGLDRAERHGGRLVRVRPAEPARAAWPARDLFVGAENDDGTAGGGLGLNVAPTQDLVITTAPGTPGGSLHYRSASTVTIAATPPSPP